MILRYLKAKHWQLFLITFGIPMLFQFVIFGLMISNLTFHSNQDPSIVFKYLKLFPVIMIVFMLVFYGWFWSVGIGLQKKVPENISLNVKIFKVLFFISLIYMTLFMVFLSFFMNGIFSSYSSQIFEVIGGLFAVILPLHLFSMFCIIYSLYFVAKTYKTVELQREVKFEEFIGEFFLIWFYPIGIWILQPKINKIADEF